MMNPSQACTDNACSTSEEPISPRSTSSTGKVAMDVVSDVICPWCWIGKRRLEKALKLAGWPDVTVNWKPFQLNPQMPPQGIERRAYRTKKFGTWERSLALDAQVAAAGAEEGLTFAFEKMTRTPNTFDTHRLIWLAGNRGVQDAVVERLFRGYFEEGLDLNDRVILVQLAVEGGVPEPEVERLLDDDAGREEVLREEAQYKSLAVSSVPTFFVNGQLAFAGAAAPGMLAEGIRQAVGVRQA